MASEKITAMIEEVKSLTVLELNDLVKALEEEFGVSAAAMAAPAAGGAATGAAAEEKTEFDVVLASFDAAGHTQCRRHQRGRGAHQAARGGRRQGGAEEIKFPNKHKKRLVKITSRFLYYFACFHSILSYPSGISTASYRTRAPIAVHSFAILSSAKTSSPSQISRRMVSSP